MKLDYYQTRVISCIVTFHSFPWEWEAGFDLFFFHICVTEMSHRSPEYAALNQETMDLLTELL